MLFCNVVVNLPNSLLTQTRDVRLVTGRTRHKSGWRTIRSGRSPVPTAPDQRWRGGRGGDALQGHPGRRHRYQVGRRGSRLDLPYLQRASTDCRVFSPWHARCLAFRDGWHGLFRKWCNIGRVQIRVLQAYRPLGRHDDVCRPAVADGTRNQATISRRGFEGRHVETFGTFICDQVLCNALAGLHWYYAHWKCLGICVALTPCWVC